MDHSLTVLLFLLPGLLASEVKGLFIGAPRARDQDRLVRALGYNVLILPLVYLMSLPSGFFGGLLDGAALGSTGYASLFGFAVGAAVIVGGIAGVVAHRGIPYTWFYKRGWTQETGKPSGWEEVFTDQEIAGVWGRVYLGDGRCYQGWVKYYGTAGAETIFLSRKGGWQVKSWTRCKPTEESEINGPGVFIPSGREIQAIEFWDGADAISTATEPTGRSVTS